MSWTLLSIILQTITGASKSGKFLPETILGWFDTVASFLRRGEPTEKALKALKDAIEEMVLEGRDPTDAEWEALRKRSDAAHERIQAYNG